MRSALVAALAVLAGCGDDHHSAVDASGSGGSDGAGDDGGGPDANPLTPPTLAGTGLCMDAQCATINPDAKAYLPSYELWADGATKRRWIQVPEGMQIDTSDMNYWKFPVGTKLWKEFSVGGAKVETRYIVKLADESEANPWYFVAYQWNTTGDDTTAVTIGADNVNGTQHDIPSRGQCHQCHDGVRGADLLRGHILGVNALSLDRPTDTTGNVTLQTLVTDGKLTDPPAAASGVGAPFFPLTGFTADEKAAFTYLHANCGHCHNPTSATHDSIPMELRLDVGKLASGPITPTYLTTVGVKESQGSDLPNMSLIVDPGMHASSVMYSRMTATDTTHMPLIASEVIDTTGVDAITAWIDGQ